METSAADRSRFRWVVVTLLLAVAFVWFFWPTTKKSGEEERPPEVWVEPTSAPVGAHVLDGPRREVVEIEVSGGFDVVVLNEEGQKVKGVEVTPDDNATLIAQDGTLSLDDIPKQIKVLHPSYTPSVVAIDEQMSAAGGVVVEVRKGGYLVGRVVDRDGNGISSAEVCVSIGGVAAGHEGAFVLARHGGIAYHRTTQTDPGGSFRFDSLIEGEHVITCTSPGHILMGEEGASDRVVHQVGVGSNTVDIRMLRIFVVAVGFRNIGPGPDSLLSSFGRINVRLPRGLVDLPLGETANRTDEYVRNLITTPCTLKFVRAATESLTVAKPMCESRILANWLAGDRLDAAIEFVELNKFSEEKVRVFDVVTGGRFGRVRVQAPFPVTLWHGTGAITFQTTVSPESKPVVVEVPVGEYRIGPSWTTFLSSNDRAKRIQVSEGVVADVNFTDHEIDCGKLIISVFDSNGHPAREFSVQVIRRSDGAQTNVGSSNGSVIELYCESGKHILQLRDLAHRKITNQETVVVAGQETSETMYLH